MYWIKFHEELDIDVIANLFLAQTEVRVVKMYVHQCICVCDNLPKGKPARKRQMLEWSESES